MASSSVILPLPPDVVAQIRSSIAITSLNGVILGLFKNSLDASAKNIEISVHYSRGSCTVDDDGLGIPPLEFQVDGGLAKLHHSSKLNSSAQTHGVHGTFLASLAVLSMVSITSRSHLHHSYNAVSLHRSEVISRMTPAPQLPQLFSVRHGTRVVVRDLFGNMPVRVKHRALAESQHGSAREWEELRRGVTGLLLAWPSSVSINVRCNVSDRKIRVRGGVYDGLPSQMKSCTSLQLSVYSILSQVGFLSSPEKDSWICTSASTSTISIHGAISLVPAPTKQAQFISLGIQLVENHEGRNSLYDEINRQFTNSAFGNEETQTIPRGEVHYETEERADKRRGIASCRKGVDRWPMFFIKIDLLNSAIDPRSGVDRVVENSQNLNCILELLRAMTTEFLRRHNFRPKNIQNLPGDFSGGTKKIETGDQESLKSKNTVDIVESSGKVEDSSATQRENIGKQSPFDGWSRIKYGRPTSVKNVENEPSTQNTACTDLVKDAPSKFQATVAKSGMIIGRPFSDALTSSKATKQYTVKSAAALGKSDTTSGHCNASVVEWANPISKNVSFVNSRTGLAQSLSSSATVSTSPFEGKKRDQERISVLDKHKVNEKHVSGSDSWIEKVLQKWNNPVFCPAEAPIPHAIAQVPEVEALRVLHGHQHLCSQTDSNGALSATAVGTPGQLSKANLSLAEIVSQVDNKFILIMIPLLESASRGHGGEILVLVDQHAADERCRIEELMASLCTKPDLSTTDLLQTTCIPGVQTSRLPKPIHFDISLVEIRLLQSNIQHFANWGILYQLPSSAAPQPHSKVTVSHLPPGIAKRCSSDPKLLIELIRSECWKRSERSPKALDQNDIFSRASDQDDKHYWVTKTRDCPQGIIDMLNSRSCRSAIMFNDELSQAQCESLIQRLAECAFPFQCAHGRPSMVPLANIETLSQVMRQKPEQTGLAEALRRWTDTKRRTPTT